MIVAYDDGRYVADEDRVAPSETAYCTDSATQTGMYDAW
jgi:hypothetical protein